MVPDFSATLQRDLRKRFECFFTADQIARHQAFVEGLGTGEWQAAHPASDIVSQLLAAAYPLKVSLDRRKNYARTRGEILAEHADFLKSLRTTQRKLRTLSPDLDRLLGIDADTLGIADLMDDLIGSVERATALVKHHPDYQRARVFNSKVAKELAQAALEIFDANNLTIAARVGSAGGASLLISTLKCIGDAMNLYLADKTWKNTVAAVRKPKSKVSSADR